VPARCDDDAEVAAGEAAGQEGLVLRPLPAVDRALQGQRLIRVSGGLVLEEVDEPVHRVVHPRLVAYLQLAGVHGSTVIDAGRVPPPTAAELGAGSFLRLSNDVLSLRGIASPDSTKNGSTT